ncbi:hypothetical protein TNIN_71091 [Trichonephila inaurata madagascariensis]|uniref:Uncharacterized protein n=1 Tax=Trichonephila inaurata madagascariensis TaxID=2747483 RepID=A0A8X6YI94_9ARAC|nr:hypothetical protein TNIN_71091 [Trichonephila inaurata madagascariensis]
MYTTGYSIRGNSRSTIEPVSPEGSLRAFEGHVGDIRPSKVKVKSDSIILDPFPRCLNETIYLSQKRNSARRHQSQAVILA